VTEKRGLAATEAGSVQVRADGLSDEGKSCESDQNSRSRLIAVLLGRNAASLIEGEVEFDLLSVVRPSRPIPDADF
jgi:hypothetical protein